MGEFLVIVAQFVWAIALVLIKKLSISTNPILIVSGVVTIGAIIMIPLFLFQVKELKILDHRSLIFLIIAGFLWIVIGEILYTFGVSSISISRVSLLTLTFPVFVVLLGIIFLGETITWRFITASLLMAAGYLVLVL